MLIEALAISYCLPISKFLDSRNAVSEDEGPFTQNTPPGKLIPVEEEILKMDQDKKNLCKSQGLYERRNEISNEKISQCLPGTENIDGQSYIGYQRQNEVGSQRWNVKSIGSNDSIVNYDGEVDKYDVSQSIAMQSKLASI